jgi:uncharacterized protein (TIGR02996 family)
VSESDEQIRATLLADILANPDDDGPRLVLADWLSQRGDPRGELISVQCLLENTAGGERARLLNRSSDLLYRHGTWLREYLDIVRGVETKRGFVHAINATANVFAKQCGPLFDKEPIEELRLIAPRERDVAALAKAPHLVRLRALKFLAAMELHQGHTLRALFAMLANVRLLDLRFAVTATADAGFRQVLATLRMPNLARMKLDVRADSPAMVASLATASLPAMRQLAVRKDAVSAMRAAFPNVEVTALSS